MRDSSNLTLVLGHAASGKSAWSEAEVLRTAGSALYIATAQALDAEMRAKIELHAARRGAAWSLVEEPLDLALACSGVGAGTAVLIDCATLWLTNMTLAGRDWQPAAADWIAAMAASGRRFTVVSNDVGGGVTPDNALARAFQRAQGELNQRLAAAAERVVLVTAGLPQVLK